MHSKHGDIVRFTAAVAAKQRRRARTRLVEVEYEIQLADITKIPVQHL